LGKEKRLVSIVQKRAKVAEEFSTGEYNLEGHEEL